jgi:phosphate transport system permease protein
VVLKKSLPGVAAACVLGLSRAFGETIAVMMVVGNVPLAPTSLFSPAYPLPALLANNYGEMLSIPGYESALNLAAIILLLIVIIFSLAARIYLTRLGRRAG